MTEPMEDGSAGPSDQVGCHVRRRRAPDRPLAEPLAPSHTTAVDGVFAGVTPEQRLYLHYLAAMSLLGRVCGQTDRYAAEVERAFRDANELLAQRGSDAYFERCLPRGYSLFERKVR